MWQPAVKCVCSLFFFSAELMNDREGENKEGRRKQWNILRVLNLCVLFSNPVGLNLLWSFKMWPFLNPPHNFSFHFTLPEQTHLLSLVCLSSIILLFVMVFLCPVHGNNTSSRVLRAGRWSHLQQKSIVENWPGSLSFLCCFPPMIRGRRAESHQMSTSERSRCSTHFHLLYFDASLVGVICVVLPPPFCLFAAWPLSTLL